MDAIGELVHGCRVCGITRGQFDLIDILRAVLEQTGPGSVTLAAWTFGIRDIHELEWLESSGEIRDLRLITDASFPSAKPTYAAAMERAFGDGTVIISKSHAKWFVVVNDDWSVVVRSSMNCNRNPRIEQFDLDENPTLAEFFLEFADELALLNPGMRFESADAEEAFADVMGGGDWRERGAGGKALEPTAPLSVRLNALEKAQVHYAAAVEELGVFAWLRRKVLHAANATGAEAFLADDDDTDDDLRELGLLVDDDDDDDDDDLLELGLLVEEGGAE